MPVEYDISDDILVVRLHGHVQVQEFEDYLNDTAADPRYRSDLPRLITIDDDTTFPTSSEIVKNAMRAAQRGIGPNVRFAFVARAPLAIGITSMFMGNAGLGENYHVFPDEAQARAWLAGS